MLLLFLAPTKVSKKNASPKKDISRESTKKTSNKEANKNATVATNKKEKDKKEDRKASDDDTFREFQRVCKNVADNDAYTDKTAIIKRMFTNGVNKSK